MTGFEVGCLIVGIIGLFSIINIIYYIEKKKMTIQMAIEDNFEDIKKIIDNDEFEKAVEYVITILPDPYKTEIALINQILKEIIK